MCESIKFILRAGEEILVSVLVGLGREEGASNEQKMRSNCEVS